MDSKSSSISESTNRILVFCGVTIIVAMFSKISGEVPWNNNEESLKVYLIKIGIMIASVLPAIWVIRIRRRKQAAVAPAATEKNVVSPAPDQELS